MKLESYTQLNHHSSMSVKSRHFSDAILKKFTICRPFEYPPRSGTQGTTLSRQVGNLVNLLFRSLHYITCKIKSLHNKKQLKNGKKSKKGLTLSSRLECSSVILAQYNLCLLAQAILLPQPPK